MKQLLTLLFCLWWVSAFSQQRTPYNQYYAQPVLINPAFTGVSGVSSIFLNHRIQWVGFEDAPVTTSAIIQLPLTERIAVGMELYNDRHSSVLRTNEVKLNGAYTLYFDTNGRNYLTFGLSLGVGKNMIDFEGTDQAILNAMDRSFYFNGRFGTAIHLGSATFGFSLPQLMDTDILNEQNFEDLGLEATKKSIIHASYRFTLSPEIAVEPMALYRLDKYGENQAEAVGMVYYKDMLWAGAGYRQDYGAIAHLGLAVKQFLRVGYSYEFAPEQVTGIGNGSHEFQVTYTFGKRSQKRVPRKIITSDINSPTPAPVEEEIVKNDEKPASMTTTGPIVTDSNPSEITTSVTPETAQPLEETNVYEDVKWEEVDESREISSLPKGCYLVVGAFVRADNAVRYQNEVVRLGYKAEIAYDEATKFNYVYINKANEPKYLHAQRDAVRKKDILYFPETWILEIR
jgi:type IX secretion system PorP/SprF family membrane protein